MTIYVTEKGFEGQAVNGNVGGPDFQTVDTWEEQLETWEDVGR